MSKNADRESLPYSVSQNFLTSRRLIERLIKIAQLTKEDTVLEKGAAKRFCGLPRENLNALLLKPFFEARIVYHFRREDFHPAPRVDTSCLS